MVLATSLSKAAARLRVFRRSGGSSTASLSSSSSASANGSHSIPSFGFSGAGFLTCYHLGVADCLTRNGKLLEITRLPKDDSPLMTGVSGGALASAAVGVGIAPEDCMNAVSEIVRRTRTVGGIMDHLRPGYVTIGRFVWSFISLSSRVES